MKTIADHFKDPDVTENSAQARAFLVRSAKRKFLEKLDVLGRTQVAERHRIEVELLKLANSVANKTVSASSLFHAQKNLNTILEATFAEAQELATVDPVTKEVQFNIYLGGAEPVMVFGRKRHNKLRLRDILYNDKELSKIVARQFSNNAKGARDETREGNLAYFQTAGIYTKSNVVPTLSFKIACIQEELTAITAEIENEAREERLKEEEIRQPQAKPPVAVVEEESSPFAQLQRFGAQRSQKVKQKNMQSNQPVQTPSQSNVLAELDRVEAERAAKRSAEATHVVAAVPAVVPEASKSKASRTELELLAQLEDFGAFSKEAIALREARLAAQRKTRERVERLKKGDQAGAGRGRFNMKAPSVFQKVVRKGYEGAIDKITKSIFSNKKVSTRYKEG